jgi:hypothetical protein
MTLWKTHCNSKHSHTSTREWPLDTTVGFVSLLVTAAINTCGGGRRRRLRSLSLCIVESPTSVLLEWSRVNLNSRERQSLQSHQLLQLWLY